jgi:hypothetical protein
MLARIAITALFALFSALFASAAEESPPKLVLVLTIDQTRGDALERFRPVLLGGLATLLDRGVVFENAHQFHAVTVTAPGHASLATGLFPSRSGIVGNDWFDRSKNQNVYCVEDREAPLLKPKSGAGRGAWPSAGRSPKNLLGTALGDWMKEARPETKVYSLGGKDRSSILMGGQRANGAYWYDPRSGQWVTSRYYAAEYPDWVLEFHQERNADEYFGMSWEPTPGNGATKPLQRTGLFPDAGYYAALFDSPFIESYLLQFARALVRAESIGQDDTTDLLAISFSSVDSIGHEYGPDSPEVLDAVIRLDQELGRFFEFLEGAVGMDEVAIALSSDHGVAPLPEYQSQRGLPGGRLGSSTFECLQRVGRAFERKFGKADWFVAPYQFDGDVLASRNLTRDTVEAFLARELHACPSVARVWKRSELSSDSVDPTLELYRNSFHPERSPDLFLQLEWGFISRARGTTHGSPWEYDTHVPLIVLWPGAKPRAIAARANTVDLPVTLASLLGIETPPELDGMDRSEAIRR